LEQHRAAFERRRRKTRQQPPSTQLPKRAEL
jgi:hypothetical protein